MIVYSKKIIAFVKEIKRAISHILTQEIGVKVSGSRFCDFKQKSSYPIAVVIFNNKNMLGYFDPHFYELGFHEQLMHAKREQLHHVVRHELAHYFTYILHGEKAEAHGVEFKAFCKRMKWEEEVAKAAICLESQEGMGQIEQSSVFRKVQKLMALSSSGNQYEAELAIIKSQQLLLKHNIESKYLGAEEEEKVFLKRIMGQKKENAKMRAIGKILETFFVSIVFSRSANLTYLEILGSIVNLEIAEHVATVLDRELENLWKSAQKGASLKGKVAKNSFFLGVAKGYCNKINALKQEYTTDIAQALMVIEKQLSDAKAMAYTRLSTSRSSGSHCRTSSALGEKMGRDLNINPAVGKTSKSSTHWIESQL